MMLCIGEITSQTNLEYEYVRDFMHDLGLANMFEGCDPEELYIFKESITDKNKQLMTAYLMSNLENMKNYLLGFLNGYKKLCEILVIDINSEILPLI